LPTACSSSHAELSPAGLPPAVCYLLSLLSAVYYLTCYLLSAFRCLLSSVRCLLSVIYYLLSLLSVALPVIFCLLSAIRCLLSAV
jgi:hypothetical protein